MVSVRFGIGESQFARVRCSVSRATGTEAEESAAIMAASIRQFNLEATDAARVANVLTLGANKSFNSVTTIGEA